MYGTHALQPLDYLMVPYRRFCGEPFFQKLLKLQSLGSSAPEVQNFSTSKNVTHDNISFHISDLLFEHHVHSVSIFITNYKEHFDPSIASTALILRTLRA